MNRRNGADSEPSFGWSVYSRNETVSGRIVGEHHVVERCGDVLTAQSTNHSSDESADPAGVPAVKTPPGRHTTARIEERRLSTVAVHYTVGLIALERRSSPLTGDPHHLGISPRLRDGGC